MNDSPLAVRYKWRLAGFVLLLLAAPVVLVWRLARWPLWVTISASLLGYVAYGLLSALRTRLPLKKHKTVLAADERR
jgi:hypothetical protein